MYHHQKIEAAETNPASGGNVIAETGRQRVRSGAAVYAGLIILCLPFFLLWLLTRLLWEEAKAIGRGVAVFYRGAADEISRS